MKNLMPLVLIASSLGTSAIAAEAHKPHWGYQADNGPAHWAELDGGFATCAGGVNQSPVDIRESAAIDAQLPPLQIDWQSGVTSIVNNGHTVQVNVASGSTLKVDGVEFALKQFHFHTPSENQLNDRNLPLEAHFVHADADGNLAVVAVLYEHDEGGENQLRKLWQRMPAQAGTQQPVSDLNIDLAALLPQNRDYYRFEGSLTTPPCTEGVRWFVMKQTRPVAEEQVERFAHVMHHPNNRPVQPLHARVVLK